MLEIGEKVGLINKTPVERAAARQWVQYCITRLRSSEIDKRELEEVLQVSNEQLIIVIILFLQELDQYLNDRTYFTGQQFGISDLLIYCTNALSQYLVSSSHAPCVAINDIHSR